MSAPRKVRTHAAIASLTCVFLALGAGAQTPDTQYPPASYPQQTYPQTTYPQTTYPQTAYPQPSYAQPGKRPNPLRQLFAGTLSALIQGSDPTGLVNNVVQGLSGSLTSWFERRQQRKAQAAAGVQAPAYPSAGTYPATGAYPTTTPAYDPNSAYTYPSAATPQQPASPYATDPYAAGSQQQTNPYATDPYATNTYNYTTASANSYDWSTTQVYDPRTGQASSALSGYALASPPADATAIVAGGAYDVYALRADGSEMPVNPATHEFRSGDRFKVYFRPSLPGRLEVSNINPHGRETKIDSTQTAAGQLTTLGPYEFTATRGNEALRFVLWPCSSQQLMVATRDIVNVSGNAGGGYPAGGAYPAAQASGFPLGACSTIATRSVDKVKTRDIVKVGVDGTTSFALDPVSQAELSSGQFMPREFTVYFRHL